MARGRAQRKLAVQLQPLSDRLASQKVAQAYGLLVPATNKSVPSSVNQPETHHDGYRHLKDPPCACRPIRVEDLDELVWQQGTELLEKPGLIGAELERRRQESLKSDPLERRRGQLTQELTRVEQQIDKLLDAYQESLLPLGQLRQRMPQ